MYVYLTLSFTCAAIGRFTRTAESSADMNSLKAAQVFKKTVFLINIASLWINSVWYCYQKAKTDLAVLSVLVEWRS